MRIITVANQKGGSGKTTTTANLAGALVEAGARVLAVDFDPQAQLAAALGAQDLLRYTDNGSIESYTVADLLLPPTRGTAPTLADVIIETPYPNLDLLPGSGALEAMRGALETNPAGRFALRRVLNAEALASAGRTYDWLLIDTAPKLDVMLDNALVVADFVLAVLAPERQQAEPLTRFVGHLKLVQESIAPNVELLGVLFNRANYGWVATTTIPELLADVGMPVLEAAIPQYSRIASSYGVGPIVLTAPNTREAGVVRAAAQEVIARALGSAVPS